MGTAGTFTPTATGTPAPTITETGPLPAGVTFTGGSLTGTPTSGVFPITFTASNGAVPNATQHFTLTVNAAAAITSAATATFITGRANTFTVTATGTPTPGPDRERGASRGRHLRRRHRRALGQPTGRRHFPITFTATNGIGSPAVQSFTLTVAAPAGGDHHLAAGGHRGDRLLARRSLATGGQSPYTWSLSSGALPAGLTLGRAAPASSPGHRPRPEPPTSPPR